MKILIVGAGLFGAVCANELKTKHDVTVIDKRKTIGGNCYTQVTDDIVVHKYGAHIFRTNDEQVWNYINKFAKFNNFVNSPIARYHNEVYNLPFNMNTFAKLWNVCTPTEAKLKIQSQCIKIDNPKNLEEFALSVVGKDIYYKLIKEYTEKQWNKKCSELPTSTMRRIPIRFTYDNNYYNSKYQGIPIGGYTPIIEKMLLGTNVKLNCAYKKDMNKDYDLVIYTGCIDEFFNYQLGKLAYRSLMFEHRIYNEDILQGNAVVNYTSNDVKYTRTIEHKLFDIDNCTNRETTIVSYEYPMSNGEPYYPMETEENIILYNEYKKLDSGNVIFGGRLGSYKYTDMEETIKNALNLVETIK